MTSKQIEPGRELDATGRQRRTLLKGAGVALTWGALCSVLGVALPRGVRADGVIGKRCLTILYNAGPDVTFNFDYYRDNHLTMIMKLFGNSIKRFELRKPVAQPEGAPPAAFVAAVNIWVNDNAAFDAGNAQHGQTMVDDIKNFTSTNAVIQNDEVWGEMGGDLASPQIGARCMTIVYPAAEGAVWNADYYRDNHMPLIMRLYTTEAISRFEIRKGISAMDGTAPPYAGCVNFYIADQAKFEAAGAQHSQALRDDVKNFSSVMPSVLATDIVGLANT
jgi:uncharacterized protein (TIGR02118 family)